MDRPIVRYVKLREGANRPLQASSRAAGFDLYACPVPVEVTIRPGEHGLIGTGIAVQIPFGYEGQVRPRSGLAMRNGVTVLNSPGTIDADYTGEVGVLLVNHSQEPFTVRVGDRIAQLVIAPVAAAELLQAPELDPTERGAGGFGSTGAR